MVILIKDLIRNRWKNNGWTTETKGILRGTVKLELEFWLKTFIRRGGTKEELLSGVRGADEDDQMNRIQMG